MGQIPFEQNATSQLNLLGARNRTRDWLRRIAMAQVAATCLIPILGAVFASRHPYARPATASVALSLTFLDVWLLDRQQKKLMVKTAKLAEHFDCTVLMLPWDDFGVGNAVLQEDLIRPSRNPVDAVALQNWYPAVVVRLPTHLARLVCQRANLRFDGVLRKNFATLVLVAPILIVFSLFAGGFAVGASFANWALTLATLTPLLGWSAREHYRQADAAKVNEELLQRVDELWKRALHGAEGSDAYALKSRELQSAIFRRRSNSPPIPRFIYRLRRKSLEYEMSAAAQLLIDEFEDSLLQRTHSRVEP